MAKPDAVFIYVAKELDASAKDVDKAVQDAAKGLA